MLQAVRGEETVPTNPSEFSRLFNQYQGLIFRTAYRVTGNAADAEDVLQTVFVRLMARQADPDLHNEDSYFRRAAVNAAIDVIRSRRSDEPAAEHHQDFKAQHSRELRECLRRAFARLTPRAAEVFALRHFEDFTNGQIADALNMSPVLVAVTLHRARRQLQKEIGQYFGGKR
jgi:RNA polymerase sigma-70 factor (ECF subfamily)